MTTFIEVHVPEEHVMAVYKLLAELDATDPDAIETDDAVPGNYTPDMIEEAYEQSSPQMKAALGLLTEAGDYGLSTVQLGQDLGYEFGANAVAGMLGAFTRRCYNHYKLDEVWWTTKWISNEDGSLVTLKTHFREVLRGILPTDD